MLNSKFVFVRLCALLPMSGCLLVATARPAIAAIASTTGAMMEVTSPIVLTEAGFESSTAIAILNEGSTVTSADIFVNAFGPGTHGGTPTPTLMIPAGTLVNSYIVHFNPIGGGFATATGAVFFDPGETIIGVQTYSPLLYTTDDMLGDPFAVYPDVFIEFRAFETLPGIDGVTLPVDMGSASFTLFAELGIDQARIITIPEPGSLSIFTAGLMLLVIRRRRTA